MLTELPRLQGLEAPARACTLLWGLLAALQAAGAPGSAAQQLLQALRGEEGQARAEAAYPRVRQCLLWREVCSICSPVMLVPSNPTLTHVSRNMHARASMRAQVRLAYMHSTHHGDPSKLHKELAQALPGLALA